MNYDKMVKQQEETKVRKRNESWSVSEKQKCVCALAVSLGFCTSLRCVCVAPPSGHQDTAPNGLHLYRKKEELFEEQKSDLRQNVIKQNLFNR